MIDALSLGGNMKLNEYDLQNCIDYDKLKKKMGIKKGDKISFTFENENYIGVVTDSGVEYYDKNNDLLELNLMYFTTIEYNPKVKYKKILCAHIDCNKCPLQEIRCNFNKKYRDQTLEEILNNSISNPKIKAIYEEALEKEC